MRNISFVLFVWFMTGTAYAHIGSVDDKGGHWNYRLGTYHQHFDFEGSMVDGTYDWDLANNPHINSKMRFSRIGIRTYQINNGKHAFGIEVARQMDSDFDYGGQWGYGINYRRRYSKNTTITYSLDYCRAGKFNIIELTGVWGIYVPQVSKSLSLHIGFLGSKVLESGTPSFAISTQLEYEMDWALLSLRYDTYYDMAIYGMGLTYKF